MYVSRQVPLFFPPSIGLPKCLDTILFSFVVLAHPPYTRTHTDSFIHKYTSTSLPRSTYYIKKESRFLFWEFFIPRTMRKKSLFFHLNTRRYSHANPFLPAMS